MTRITPRTCLWPLAGSLSLTFCLSIGLTFRSNHHCFAGTCGEWLFPLQARLHVVVWYCWLSISVTVLAIRAFHPELRKILRQPLFQHKLPLLGKQLAFSGLLVVVWVVLLYGVIVSIWWIRLRDYFSRRGLAGGVTLGNARLAAIALTGHMADVTMGMAIIPISRHSALASFFKISVATTLAFHMVTAYTLFMLIIIHGLLYATWVPTFERLSAGLRMVFPVLNPTYLYHETWPGNHSSLGVWRASLVFTGSTATFIFFLIFITTLPIIRKKHFNLFYFTHLLGIIAIVVICLHASTMFYCTAPGLMMWLLDWLMRLYELWGPLDGKIESLGKGWYGLTVPLPRRRLDGCACTSPLAHFYIYHSDTSIRELHPFTTATHLASQNTVTSSQVDDISIFFLFRKSGTPKPTTPVRDAKCPPSSTGKSDLYRSLHNALSRVRRHPEHNSQWTDRLAEFAYQDSVAGSSTHHNPSSTVLPLSSLKLPTRNPPVPVSLRLEGPYFTIADPAHYRTVVCIVAGTGISGALAIAGAFRELERQSAVATIESMEIEDGTTNGVRTNQSVEGMRGGSVMSLKKGVDRVWTRCVVIWSVREEQYIELDGLESSPSSALTVQIHLTGNDRKRLSVGDALDEILDVSDASQDDKITSTTQANTSTAKENVSPQAPMWVYISGPNAFIAAGEDACKKRQGRGVEWYGARWDI